MLGTGQHPGVPPTLALSRVLVQKGSLQLVGMGWPLSLGAGGIRKGLGRAPQILSHAVCPPPSSKLQLRLEKVTDESQERMDDQAATITKLNKALQGKIQVSPRQNWASAHPGAEPNWDGAGI